jgi:hypothetical protein
MEWDTEANAYFILRDDSQLAWDVDLFLWKRYDPQDGFIYPNIKGWDDLLERTIDNDSYAQLSKDEVLSILFGLHHRTRIIDGLWISMFERDITQKLLKRLLLWEPKNG